MNSSRSGRGSHLEVLREIGRNFLARLLDHFAVDLAVRQLTPPEPDATDTEFFTRTAEILAHPTLPGKVTEVVTALAAITGPPVKLSPAQERPTLVRYSLQKHNDVWSLTFNCDKTLLGHHRSIFHVRWLLYNPPPQPIHGVDLNAKIPEFYRQQTGLPALIDPATGKSIILPSDARLQERSLALDDVENMRQLYRKEREFQDIIESDSQEYNESQKNEARRKLQQIADFQTQYAKRSIDAAQRMTRTIREGFYRLHRRYSLGFDRYGKPDPVARAFALHLQNCIIIPSGGCGRHSKGRAAGTFTYDRPNGVKWE